MGEAVTFEDVLQREERIFTDTEISPQEQDGWYNDTVYGARRYSQLNHCLLFQVLQSAEEMRDWMSNPRVNATARVADEIKRFRDIIRNKLKFLNRYERQMLRGRHRVLQDSVGRDMGKDLLESIGFVYHQIFGKARHKQFKPRHQQMFSYLEQMVLDVAATTDAKRDHAANYGKLQAEDLHADESLVAAALYTAVVDFQPSAIVTLDIDIRRLLEVTLRKLACGEIKDTYGVYGAARYNNIRVYVAVDDGLERVSDTARVTDTARVLVPQKSDKIVDLTQLPDSTYSHIA